VRMIRDSFGPEAVAPCLAWNSGTLRPLCRPILRRAEGRITQGLYCGIVPSSAPMAQARRVDGGALILISSGMIGIILDFTIVTARCIRLDTPEDAQFDLFEPSYAADLITAMSDNLRKEPFTWLQAPGVFTSALAAALPRATGWRADQEQRLMSNLLRFVLAHEIAHVALGHLDAEDPYAEAGRALPPFRRLMLGSHLPWQQEMEADAGALRLMLQAGPDHWEEPFLGLLLFTEMIAQVFPSPVTSSHPHPIVRRSAAIFELQRDGSVPQLKADPLTGLAQFDLAEPMACALFALTRHRYPEGDRTALATLKSWTEGRKGSELPGTLLNGIRTVADSDMEAELADDFDRASLILAQRAAKAATVPVMLVGSYIVRFGVTHHHYRRLWATHPRYPEVMAMLEGAIPCLEMFLHVWERSAFIDEPREDTRP
ncbi:hypothetical protein LCGC14_2011280, partial [marine sediment metagenome]